MQTRTGFAPSNSLELAYEDLGDPDDPVVPMIMGLSTQLTLRPTEFCERIVQQGFRVIGFALSDEILGQVASDIARIRRLPGTRKSRHPRGVPARFRL